MINKNITLEGVKIPVHEFLDDQKVFLTDAGILCGGLHNIFIRDKRCAQSFLKSLDNLQAKIYKRYQITLGLSDSIAGKQEVSIGMGKLLQDIGDMQEVCKNQVSEVVH